MSDTRTPSERPSSSALSYAQADSPPAARRQDWLGIGAAALIFSALSIWMAVRSNGFLEADGITHYLARRFALDQTLHLVGVWSRPLCVALYAVPAHFGGLIGTRLMSLLLVLVMMGLTLVVARRLQLGRPAVVALLLLTQPLLFAHSFSELTEIPFALLLLTAFWAYCRKQFLLLAILAAISPLARPEGFGLILVVALALAAHRRWWWGAILPLGIIGWSWAGWYVFGQPQDYAWYQWLGRNWPYSPDSMYGRGSPFWFIIILPVIAGPIAFPLLWIGARRLVRSSVWPDAKLPLPVAPVDANPVGTVGYEPLGPQEQKVNRWLLLLRDHDAICRLLVVLIPFGILVAHSLLWAFGKMASNGEPRYMLIVSPFWALLAAAGAEWVIRRFNIAHPLRWGVLAGLLPILANLYYPAFPLGEQDDDRLARDVRQWLDTVPEVRERYPVFAGALPHLYIQMDLDRLNRERIVDSSRTVAAKPPAGVLLIWDNIYSTHNSNAEYCINEEDLLANGWIPIQRFKRGIAQYKRYMTVYLSPLDKDEKPALPGVLPGLELPVPESPASPTSSSAQ